MREYLNKAKELKVVPMKAHTPSRQYHTLLTYVLRNSVIEYKNA